MSLETGLPKESDPLPLSLKKFRSLLEVAMSSDPPPSLSAESFSREQDGLDSDVEEARTIEGDSGGEEYDQAPTNRRANDAVSSGNPPTKEEWWSSVAYELEGVFSHWSSLSGSFSNVGLPRLSQLPDTVSQKEQLTRSFPDHSSSLSTSKLHFRIQA